MTLISPMQCRAARAFLLWSQGTLAQRSAVPLKTIARFETGRHATAGRDVKRLMRTFRAANILFLADEGVSLLPSATAAIGEPAADLSCGAGSAATVLLVDDDVLHRYAAERYLTGQGFRILAAGDAGQALHLVEAGAALDCMVLDLMLPSEAEGWALAQKVRQRIPVVPSIFVTANPEVAGTVSGADDAIFLKPAEFTSIAAEIRRRVQNAASGRASSRSLEPSRSAASWGKRGNS
jgi:CheY-like chemotaxis protein